jgi:hypothetical protein
VKKLPNVNYFCQNVALPSISLGVAQTSTPFGYINRPGDKLAYSQLPIRFRVDEDFKNYLEIHDWMVGMGHPEDFNQSRELSASSPSPIRKIGTASSFVSDGTLTIQNSNKNSSINIFFMDLFPIDLTELMFDSTGGDVDYLEATATFSYRRYKIERI